MMAVRFLEVCMVISMVVELEGRRLRTGQRRAHPTTRPLPWEYAEEDWDTLDAERQLVLDQNHDAA